MTRPDAAPRTRGPTRRAVAKLRREEQPCWLCGRSIDPELRSPHPASFTADHVVPVSKGGAVGDIDNMRAAHRLCNMQRGAGAQSPRTRGDRSAGW